MSRCAAYVIVLVACSHLHFTRSMSRANTLSVIILQCNNSILAAATVAQSSTHPGLSPEAKDLIARMLTVKPAERITMEQILTHPWLSGGASENHLGCAHAQRVKTLNIRRKLQKVFKIRHVTSPAVPPPPPALADGDALHALVDEDDVTSWTDTDIEAEARYYFNVIDNDGDGIVTKEDLRVGVARLINDISGADHNDVSSASSLRMTPGALQVLWSACVTLLLGNSVCCEYFVLCFLICTITL